MKFSEKIGKTPLREIIQIEQIDIKLENRIWNNILINFFEEISSYISIGKESRRGKVCKIIWTDFFNKRVDEIPKLTRGNVDVSGTIRQIKAWFFKSEWYEKYDFIEFLSQVNKIEAGTRITEHLNTSLELEMSGYRIINESIVQITSEEEIIEIEEAISFSDQYKSVNTHLKSALNYFSNRESPDYRNSIKESISAIESLCSIITGDKKSSLGQALGVIEKEYEIHSAMKKAFSALYGYTSDSGGIRHKLLEEDINVSFEDAKFMLVSCSAFINYLKVKVNK
tara:strand:+ start:74 stop:922 length:849 start_codon:yes stop_codon:yes gene_type:complete